MLIFLFIPCSYMFQAREQSFPRTIPAHHTPPPVPHAPVPVLAFPYRPAEGEGLSPYLARGGRGISDSGGFTPSP
jgi:hypothetical protein